MRVCLVSPRIAPSSLLAVAFLAAATTGHAAADPVISDAEQAELLGLLDEAQAAVLDLVSGTTDQQWSFKESPDRWSVGECVEHIVRSEAAMIETVRAVLAGEPDPDWESRTRGKTAFLRQVVPDRRPQGQGGVRAPEEVRPTEDWGRRRGIAEFYRVHGEARSLVETLDPAIKDRTRESSNAAMGWLNAYDWLNLLPLHVLRHSRQIAEVQADPAYPAREAVTPTAGGEPDPWVSDEELATLIADIDTAQERLLGLISGLSDEQWTFREEPGRWSIAECVEHIAATEGAVLGGIELTFMRAPDPNWFERTRGKNAMLRQAVLTRPAGGVGSPFRAPGEVAPSQGWDRATGFLEFYRAHGELRAFVETMRRDIKNRTFENPFPQIGTLNGYDWLTLTALHIRRHSEQIAEVKAHPDFPR